MANSPLFTALERGVDEVIVVLLSPVGHVSMPFPGTLINSLELVFEHLLSGSYQTTLSVINQIRGGDSSSSSSLEVGKDHGVPTDNQSRMIAVAPSRMLGFRSLLNFSTRQARQLVDEGYRNARDQLRSYF